MWRGRRANAQEFLPGFAFWRLFFCVHTGSFRRSTVFLLGSSFLASLVLNLFEKRERGKEHHVLPPEEVVPAQTTLFSDDENFHSPVLGPSFRIIFAVLCPVWRYGI
jgi:hypothetical protein